MEADRRSERRALVTGGTGFIGSYVARTLLEHGRTVTLLGRSRDLSPQTRFVLGSWAGAVGVDQVDLEDSSRMSRLIEDLRPAEIVHVAAVV
ncbi:MAG TPA: GDP-mannose 4,6-dehydratase, partial [Patescibacteria group bacterium]|nr:GDP-mannose 4,6-dehydratase [Patescibacteria group bacterium]